MGGHIKSIFEGMPILVQNDGIFEFEAGFWVDSGMVEPQNRLLLAP
jgi:hypothetical protein